MDPEDSAYPGRLAFESFVRARQLELVAEPWSEQDQAAWSRAADSVKCVEEERPSEDDEYDSAETTALNDADSLHLDAAHED